MRKIYNNQSTKEHRRELRKNPTNAERKIWSILKGEQMGVRFFRQYSIGPYVIDFYCPQLRIALEMDGGQHAEEKHRIHDAWRTEYLRKHDIRMLRFWNNEVMQNLEGVGEKIKETIASSPYVRRFGRIPTP